ncbi:carbohydrate kinase family protein [Halorubellus litoreus]|uniref:Carbohydrate kinase family protein n=1 Tax=Halorubellus litoreus TaxID=755308 RepID=A0ABD5VKZ1_9EURY
MPDVRVLVAGHVNWDVTLRVDQLPEPDGESRIHDQRSSGGGSAANVAYDLTLLDVPAGIVGSVGDDEYGFLATRELEESGVDLSGMARVEGAETTVKYVLVEEGGEVSMLANDGANEAVAPADVDDAFVASAEHVHLTSQRPDTAAHIARVASDAGATVSVDPGRRLAHRDYGDVLSNADVVFVNDKEAEVVLDAPPKEVFAGQVLVVKRGAAGAEVHAPEGHFEHPGFGIDPVDTTGAGDAFAAAFVATRLDGGDYHTALERANAAGAYTASTEGARQAPTSDALAAFLDERT